MDETKKTLLDRRIEQFCESSAELLTGIHTRHNRGALKQKRKREVEEIIAIPDLDIDFHEDGPLEDMPE